MTWTLNLTKPWLWKWNCHWLLETHLHIFTIHKVLGKCQTADNDVHCSNAMKSWKFQKLIHMARFVVCNNSHWNSSLQATTAAVNGPHSHKPYFLFPTCKKNKKQCILYKLHFPFCFKIKKDGRTKLTPVVSMFSLLYFLPFCVLTCKFGEVSLQRFWAYST